MTITLTEIGQQDLYFQGVNTAYPNPDLDSAKLDQLGPYLASGVLGGWSATTDQVFSYVFNENNYARHTASAVPLATTAMGRATRRDNFTIYNNSQFISSTIRSSFGYAFYSVNNQNHTVGTTVLSGTSASITDVVSADPSAVFFDGSYSATFIHLWRADNSSRTVLVTCDGGSVQFNNAFDQPTMNDGMQILAYRRGTPHRVIGFAYGGGQFSVANFTPTTLNTTWSATIESLVFDDPSITTLVNNGAFYATTTETNKLILNLTDNRAVSIDVANLFYEVINLIADDTQAEDILSSSALIPLYYNASTAKYFVPGYFGANAWMPGGSPFQLAVSADPIIPVDPSTTVTRQIFIP